MLTALADDVDVVALDARGHGSTSLQPEDDFSLSTLVDDALAVLAQLALKGDVFLVGHSMGGVVATHVADRLLRLAPSPKPDAGQ